MQGKDLQSATDRASAAAKRSQAVDDGAPAPQGAVSESESAPTQVSPGDGPGEDEWVGRVLDGRYRVVRPLAKGGMGAVYVAEHLALRKEVALKVIRPEFVQNQEIAIRFAREAMAMAQFEHPHVATAIDIGTLPEGGSYFVMQLVRGQSLRRVMRQAGPLPWRRVCAIGAQVADALSEAQSRGIVHRDLKPDNVLVEVREDGSDLVKILDFGIARMDVAPEQGPVEAKPGEALTRVGMVMGTPGYMAPEQAVGDELDHRADLYALGVVLWEAITGRELWTGGDITALITRQIQQPAPHLRTVCDDRSLPQELDDLIDQLLSRQAAHRPDFPGDVRDALRGLSLVSVGTWGETQPGLTAASVGQSIDRAWTRTNRSAQAVALQLSSRFPRLGRLSTPLLAHPSRTAGAALFLIAVAWLTLGDTEAPEQPAAGRAHDAAATQARQSTVPPGSTPDTRSVSTPARARTGGDPPAPQNTAREVGAWVAAAQNMVKPALDMLNVVPTAPLPEALEEPVTTMLESRRARPRRRAARTILKHSPPAEVPEHLRALAKLEASRTCSGRRKAIERLGQLADVRTRPSLERYRDAPRRGCGFLGLSDCYSCVRPDILAALARFPAQNPESGPAIP